MLVSGLRLTPMMRRIGVEKPSVLDNISLGNWHSEIKESRKVIEIIMLQSHVNDDVVIESFYIFIPYFNKKFLNTGFFDKIGLLHRIFFSELEAVLSSEYYKISSAKLDNFKFEATI